MWEVLTAAFAVLVLYKVVKRLFTKAIQPHWLGPWVLEISVHWGNTGKFVAYRNMFKTERDADWMGTLYTNKLQKKLTKQFGKAKVGGHFRYWGQNSVVYYNYFKLDRNRLKYLMPVDVHKICEETLWNKIKTYASRNWRNTFHHTTSSPKSIKAEEAKSRSNIG